MKLTADRNVALPVASERDPPQNSGTRAAGTRPSFIYKLLKCRLFVSAILFLALSLFAGQCKVGKLSPADYPFFTWTACAIDDFLSSRQGRPQIDFVGSSLMLVPLGGVDADLLGKPVDAPYHHNSLFVEEQLKRLTGHSVSTFNFALPGEMPSDAYLITKFLLKGEKAPDVLVYGVGPRDFLDNLLPSPGATDPYQYLSRFGDTSDRIDLIAPGWQERLNWELGQIFYPYGAKSDLSLVWTKFATSAVDKILPGKPITLLARHDLLPDYRTFEVGSNTCLFRPTNSKNRPGFADNIGEYRKRYKELKWGTYLSQMNFLADILNTARERHIQAVIVSMPITDVNRKLITPLAWDTYRRGIKVLALAKGAIFIDMQGSGKFALSDFGDTVHLHSGGGRKFLALLSQKLSADKRVRAALRLPPPPIKGSPSIDGSAALAAAKGGEPL